ncbi:MAG TPA: hypothetical protein VF465_16535, partial [Flavobacterium sp.]|uniref:TRAFAC clade GTPase domain-containing protein n=1 Tax=Flavobacterium sp. TaxID=239 RepID=UPI002ED5564D
MSKKSKSNKCMFLGLPNSGKSSFIGAFWHVVETGEIDAHYKVTTQPSDREYLNALRASFLNCQAPERTKTDFVKNIELSILDKTSKEEIELVFPDLSGETFSSQFAYRKITDDYIDQIQNCNGIMLFINPDFVKKANLIADSFLMFGSEELSNNVEESASSLVPWDVKMSQTQVVIVDVLQMIFKYITKPCKISIVVSAWDLIKNMPLAENIQTPAEWLSRELPLLKQYLDANNASFKYNVFGVSAQGGSYKEDENDIISKLQELVKQSERICVQHES